jgi:hypothetical protein
MPIENSAPTRLNGAGMSGGRSLKRGWKPPALMMKVGLSPKSERDEEDARVAQQPVEPELQRIEHDAAGNVHLQVEHRERFLDERRQRDDHLANDDDLAGFDQDANARGDQAGRAPPELEHRADNEAARAERKDRAQLIDDLRRVGDRVLREEKAVQRPGREAGGQRRRVDRVLNAEKAPNAGEREPVSKLNWRQLRGDDEQQRPAARVLRRQQAYGLDADLHQLDVEDAAGLAAIGIEEEETAALDHAGVDGQAGARWRLEVESCERLGPRQEVVQIKLAAEAIDRTGKGPDRNLEGSGNLDVDPIERRTRRQLEVEEWDLDRAVGNLLEGDRCLEPGAVLEAQTRRVPNQSKVQRDFDGVANHRSEQRIVSDAQHEPGVAQVQLHLRRVILQADAAGEFANREMRLVDAAQHQRRRRAAAPEGHAEIEVGAELRPRNRGRQRHQRRQLERRGQVVRDGDLQREALACRLIHAERAFQLREQLCFWRGDDTEFEIELAVAVIGAGERAGKALWNRRLWTGDRGNWRRHAGTVEGTIERRSCWGCSSRAAPGGGLEAHSPVRRHRRSGSAGAWQSNTHWAVCRDRH